MGSALLFAGTQRAGTAGGSAGRGLGAAAFMLGGVAQGVDLALFQLTVFARLQHAQLDRAFGSTAQADDLQADGRAHAADLAAG